MTKNKFKHSVVDLTEDDDLVEKTARLKIKNEEEHDDKIPDFGPPDLTDEDGLDGPDFIRELTPGSDIDLKLAFGHIPIPIVQSDGEVLSPGTDVRLTGGDFLRIRHIVKDVSSGEVYLQGILLRRTRQVQDMLTKKCNELFIIMKADLQNGDSAAFDDCLVRRSLSDVFAVCRIIFTNRPFPALSWREGCEAFCDIEDVEARGTLVCRWKYVEYYSATDRKVKEESLEHLREGECDPVLGMSDVLLRRNFRGEDMEDEPQSGKKPKSNDRRGETVDLTADVPKPGVKGRKRNGDHIDLTGEDDDDFEEVVETRTQETRKRINRSGVFERRSSTTVTEHFTSSTAGVRTKNGRKQYTYGDICAGAGGMARGAFRAGLVPKFLLDHWKDACETLRLNFRCKVLETDIFTFCTSNFKDVKVDVLHISFPCQPHSPVHTVPGKNDEANIAAGYSAVPILQKCKPRIVTLEQTSGIITHRGGWHFRALVNQLTSMNYSVRWKIIDCSAYGNVQARKRLFIIASCPGELLPSFPAETHGPGLRPLTTIRDRLARLLGFIEPHMRHSNPTASAPYNANTVLKNAILCDGGPNAHPDGGRTFAIQELALLQDFPPEHKFAEAGIGSLKKQIGNAVPSCVAKAIFGKVIESLRASDEVAAKYKPEVVSLLDEDMD